MDLHVNQQCRLEVVPAPVAKAPTTDQALCSALDRLSEQPLESVEKPVRDHRSDIDLLIRTVRREHVAELQSFNPRGHDVGELGVEARMDDKALDADAVLAAGLYVHSSQREIGEKGVRECAQRTWKVARIHVSAKADRSAEGHRMAGSCAREVTVSACAE